MGEEEGGERHLEQLVLAAEAGVGVAVMAFPVLLDDEAAALLRHGIRVQLLRDGETWRPELIGTVVPQHDEELQPTGGGRGGEEKIIDTLMKSSVAHPVKPSSSFIFMCLLKEQQQQKSNACLPAFFNSAFH